MTDTLRILTFFNPERLAPLLSELFALDDLDQNDVRIVHGGYMGLNFRIKTNGGVFFLKQYRNRINTVIHEIKAAETYFAQAGLPVILPLKDSYGREAFWLDDHWYSLFPFVEGHSPEYGNISVPCLQALAKLLSAFHHAGKRFPQRPFQMLRMGNRRKFTMEAVELLRQLQQRPSRSALDDRMREVLEHKTSLVAKTPLQAQDFALQYDCLLHGDYQYLNTFVDETGEITHVFDLERASLGPSAYEVARSLIINCFDDGWGQKNFAHARLYLSTYRNAFPLSQEDFLLATRLYAYNIMHMTWIEARYIVFGVEMQLPVFERHVRRLEMLTTIDLRQFCEQVWER